MRARLSLIAFGSAVSLSAALVFLVQPMFARMVLPVAGGSPAAFTTSMAFYQVAMLLGVGAAHLAQRLSPRVQALGLAAVAVAGAALLPMTAPVTGPSPGAPVLWLLAALVASVGLPYVVLAAAGPLLQRWYADEGRDPWPLYVASNVGSLGGLLAYPLIVEPLLPLSSEAAAWTAGYGVLVLLLAGLAASRWRAAARAPETASAPLASSLRWGARAAVSTALMVAVTTSTTTDIASLPLVWVVPLAVYLATLALAFSRFAPPAWLLMWAWPLASLPLVVVLAFRANEPAPLLLMLHLQALLVGALAVHRVLADDRPAPAQLTAFSLSLAAGGAVGGSFASLVAPLVFTGTTELPVALVAVGLVLPWERPRQADVLLACVVVALVACGVALVPAGPGVLAVFAAVAGLVAATSTERPLRLALGTAALFIGAGAWTGGAGTVEFAHRTFYGQHRVAHDGDLRLLLHGTTLHGLQRDGSLAPLAYHHQDGPLGQVFAVARPRAVGVVGLGAGAVACLPGPEVWTFYEIDPTVVDIANSWFTFLRGCAPGAAIVVGDARLSLAASSESFDLLVLDAYSSDAIPVHLLTREAFASFMSHLAPGGSLVFNVTNRHLDVAPVVAGLASELGLPVLVREDAVTEEIAVNGRATSRWVVVGPLASALATDPRWQVIPRRVVWTDDHASVLDVVAW